MRPRDRILTNLDDIYRESYSRAKADKQAHRMEELDAAYQRDQLMMELFLDIRDLLAQIPTPPATGSGAIEKLEALRRLARLR